MGGSLVITLPAEFCQAHRIREGDDLPFAANHIMKIIPMPEGVEDAGAEKAQNQTTSQSEGADGGEQ